MWSGDPVAVNTAFNGYVNNPFIDEVSFNLEGGTPRLELVYADSSDDGESEETTLALNSVWELLPQDLYRDIRAFQTFNQAADQTKLEDTRKFFEEAHSGNGPHNADGAPYTTYLNILRRGQSEYVRTTAILQQSIAVSKRSTIAANWLGVDEAWKIDGEAGSPSPPAELIGSVAAMDEADSTKKQWLKRGPVERQINRYQYSISQQWWYARRWSKTFYNGDDEADNP